MNFIKKIFLRWKEEEIQKQVNKEIKSFKDSVENKVKIESIAFHNWISLRYRNYKHEDHFNENGTHVDTWDLWKIYVNQPEKRNTYTLHASKEPKKITNEKNSN